MILLKGMNFVENVGASKARIGNSISLMRRKIMKQSDRLLWLIANRKLFSRDVVFV